MIHEVPEGYSHYSCEEFNKTYDRVWLHHSREYIYAEGAEGKTVWGFIKRKTGAIHSPVNAKKVGKIIDPDQTTPYTAMPRPKVSPLMLLCDYD